ncbi:MAG: hypothetical protein IE917_19370, partial [Betaproteobacteria bacterium]|nr:hypothetical protein [Betaproteobacteria bacterium]
AVPKREYYYQSRQGNRLFELALGPVALAFAAAAAPEDQRQIDQVLSSGTPFAQAWLQSRGLDWATGLLASHQSAQDHQP